MKWSIIILLIIIPVSYSCEKQNYYHTKNYIQIENFTNLGFDSIKIHTNTSRGYFPDEVLTFYDIDTLISSDAKECSDLEIYLLFRAFIGGEIASGVWYCPNTYIDPAGTARIPSGFYSFGIIECDTIEDEIIIGLTHYD